MTDNPFATPAPPGDGIKWADLEGRLLLIRPLSQETGIQTAFGAADAVRADVIVLDGPEPGKEYLDTLVFPKLLSGQLGRAIGQQVLGRLTTGTAKPNQSAPWLLAEASAEDVQLGQQYLASRAPQVSSPAPAEQQPQQGWPQQQPQPGGTVPFGSPV